jgi:hypothetical protein
MMRAFSYLLDNNYSYNSQNNYLFIQPLSVKITHCLPYILLEG